MSDYYEGKFGDKPLSLLSVKEHRTKRGMSQLKLSQATHLSVPQNVISELESGIRRLTGYTLPHLCNVFEVGKEDLIIGNNMALKGIAIEDRFKAVKSVLNGKRGTEIFIASKGISRAQTLDKKLDFGSRNGWGAKLTEEEMEARKDKDLSITRDSFGRKRTDKEIKRLRKIEKEKRVEKEDFGDRDELGFKLTEKQIAEKTRIADKSFDDLDDSGDKKLADLMEGTEDAKFLAKLNLLLKKGRERG